MAFFDLFFFCANEMKDILCVLLSDKFSFFFSVQLGCIEFVYQTFGDLASFPLCSILFADSDAGKVDASDMVFLP
jgi:hypothetical protein